MEPQEHQNVLQSWSDPKTGLVGLTTFLKRLPAEEREKARKELLAEDAVTLNAPARKIFPRRKIIVHGLNLLWQADLLDMTSLSALNDGFKWILCMIDCFSRFAWAVPLKDKRGESVAAALKGIFADVKPNKLQTDQGTEFYNRDVEQVLNDYQIIHFSSSTEMKAAQAERFNRTLRMKFARLFTSKGVERWIDDLPAIVQGYNESRHTTIGMAPEDVTEEHELVLDKKLNPPMEQEDTEKALKKDMRKALRVGNLVRVTRTRGVFTKEQVDKWAAEIFRVRSVLKTKPITYELAEWDDSPIEGSWYRQELQKVEEPSKWKIEKIVRRRTRNGVKEILVKWLGFPEKYNSWEVDEGQVGGGFGGTDQYKDWPTPNPGETYDQYAKRFGTDPNKAWDFYQAHVEDIANLNSDYYKDKTIYPWDAAASLINAPNIKKAYNQGIKNQYATEEAEDARLKANPDAAKNATQAFLAAPQRIALDQAFKEGISNATNVAGIIGNFLPGNAISAASKIVGAIGDALPTEQEGLAREANEIVGAAHQGGNGLKAWNLFVAKHKGKGYSKAELSAKYKVEKRK
jgi:hypothetical protein